LSSVHQHQHRHPQIRQHQHPMQYSLPMPPPPVTFPVLAPQPQVQMQTPDHLLDQLHSSKQQQYSQFINQELPARSSVNKRLMTRSARIGTSSRGGMRLQSQQQALQCLPQTQMDWRTIPTVSPPPPFPSLTPSLVHRHQHQHQHQHYYNQSSDQGQRPRYGPKRSWNVMESAWFHTTITTTTTKKQKLADTQAYTHPTSASTWPTPFRSPAYINWFGLTPIHDFLFFFVSVLCFGCVPPLLSFIAFIISSALNCQSSICTSIIMLRFIICTYTLFLSWTTSTYHIHSYPQSFWSLLSSLPLSLPQRPFFCPHLYYLYHYNTPFDHTRFPGQFYIRYSYMLSWTIVYYNVHLAVWAGNTGSAFHGWMTEN